VFYSATFGGLVGAFFMYASMKVEINRNRNILKGFCNELLKKADSRIDGLKNECIARNVSLYKELSTKSVETSVHKGSIFSHGKPRD